MAEFTYEELLGQGATPDAGGDSSQPAEFSYEDLQAPAAPKPVQEFSPGEVYTPKLPKEAGGYPDAVGPGWADQGISIAKGFPMGAKSVVSSAMQGTGAILETSPSLFNQHVLDQMDRIDTGENIPDSEDTMGYRYMSPEEKAAARSQMQEAVFATASPDVANNPLYKAGTAVGNWGREALKPKPGTELAFDIGSGFGSVGAAILLGTVSPVAAGLTFVASGAGEAAENAVKAGATPEQIRKAALLGTPVGATDVVDALLPTLGTPGKVAGLIGKVGSKVLIGALAEGGQEGLQQLLQNLIAKGVYKPDQDIMEDVPRSALIGMIVGGVAKPVLDRGERPSAGAPTASEVQDALTGSNGETPASNAPLPSEAPQGPTPSEIEKLLGNPPQETPLEPTEILPPESPTAPKAMPPESTGERSSELPSNVVDFLARKAGSVQLPPEAANANAALQPPAEGERSDLGGGYSIENRRGFYRLYGPDGKLIADDDRFSVVAKRALDKMNPSPVKEEIEGKPGADVGRLIKLLGPQLYDIRTLTKTTIKEMFQNSFDTVRRALELGDIQQGQIHIHANPEQRTIQFYDNGRGMTPDLLSGKFLQIAGTEKEGGESSGGFGIAKAAFLFGNSQLQVRTMRDGKVASFTSTGTDLQSAMTDPSKRPKISVSKPTSEDLKLFREGHGTVIQVKIPKTYRDTSTGEQKEIDFYDHETYHDVLKHSPLFRNIEVTFNGRKLDGKSYGNDGIGRNFPAHNYSTFTNVKFPWGNMTVYVSKEKPKSSWDPNLHVLSRGLWQFSGDLPLNPLEPYGPKVPATVYLDISPKVEPDEAGYPFQLNRQGLTKQAQEDAQKVLNYISAIYHYEQFSNSVSNFGNVHYIGRTGDGRLGRTKQQKIEPKTKVETPINLIRPGDNVEVRDGRLIVNGSEMPALTPDDLKKMTPQAGTLRVDQSEINPHAVMVHDNLLVKVSDVETKTITQLATEKFGARFDEFLLGIGDMFMELRDNVVRVMARANEKNDSVQALEAADYSRLSRHAVGVSFDMNYRGVSIVIPFEGMFINPAIPEYSDPLRAAVGMVGTMIHELAHFQVRSHDADFPAEMQRIMIHLDTDNQFNLLAFKQRMVNHVAQHKDVFDYINGVYSGAYDLSPVGKRFESSGSEQGRDGSVPAAGAPAGGGGPAPTKVPGRLGFGAQPTATSQGRGESNLRVTDTRSLNFEAESRRNDALTRRDDPNFRDVPPQEELMPAKQAVAAAFSGPGGGAVPPSVAVSAVHADKMTKMFKWGFGLDRLIDRNPRFTPLLRYGEAIREMRLDASKIQDAAVRIAKRWRRLGRHSEGLTRLILDVTNMTYRKPDEVKRSIVRHPTAAEFDDLVRKHGVTSGALAVFKSQRDFFHGFLSLVVDNAKASAIRTIRDPVLLSQKLDEINAKHKTLLMKPYFPFARFGNHFVMVKNSAGDVVHFETTERQGLKSAEKMQQQLKKQLQARFGLGYSVQEGILPETATPFVGMPSVLLERIATELKLTPDQEKALDLLRYEKSGAASFQRKFSDTEITGYSHDMLRSFSRYAFHGSRYYARTKYAWRLNGQIAAARKVGGNKADAIANYMQDHLTNTVLDAKGDYGLFKGAIFLWTFGYSVAGATLNASQVPMIAFPWMAAKFGGIGKGDVKATAALTKAMVNVKNFYKRGAYSGATQFEMRAIEYGIQTGRITESQAAELAGLAQGNNLLGLGNNKASLFMQGVLEKGAFFFEMVEQFNRRIVYRAALDLAQKDPTATGVKEAMNKYADEYTKLTASGFAPAEARAIVTAAHAVEQTQFVYARETRPRFMRNRLAGTVFVFKTYLINVLQLMGADKSSVLPRFLLIMMAAGGIYGLPGAEDLEDIVNQLGKWLFGKNFNTKRALREFLVEAMGDKADLILHGLARRGFGLPALVDMLGENPSRGLGGQTTAKNVPAPVLDRSKSIGMGRLLPFEMGKLIDPGKDVDKTISEETQRTSGAIISVGFNIYKALQDHDNSWSDPKRWEKVVPRALGAASRAYRAYSEGRERTKGGVNSAATVVNYDVRDPEQMAEIVAMGLGYMPLRQSARWDEIIMQQETIAKFNFERDMLLGQLFEAKVGGRKEEMDNVLKAIKDYNSGLPEWARGKKITSETAQQSLEKRMSSKVHKEAGVPSVRADVPIARHIQSLFPESVVDVRKVK